MGYGLGNFDFEAIGAEGARTGVVRVTVTGRHIDKYEFIPGVVNGAVATPLTGTAAEAAVDYWNGLRPCTGSRSKSAARPRGQLPSPFGHRVRRVRSNRPDLFSRRRISTQQVRQTEGTAVLRDQYRLDVHQGHQPF